MAASNPPRPPREPPQPSKKRKDPPTGPTNQPATNANPNKRPKTAHRARQRDARTLTTQTASRAFQNGALDVDKFVQAREFEIRALERGIQRSGKAKNRRAFQQVPRELRRRTASHNVKRVPKRLRRRAGKEMVGDRTPTVTSKTRKPTRQMRLRVESVKRLRALGAQRKAAREREKVTVSALHPTTAEKPSRQPVAESSKAMSTPAVKSRTPRIKTHSTTPTLAKPPIPKSKFRKRQQHKSWLPTHLFHTKRAHMTPPAAPLWRFAIPSTPTQKCYRPTHRAAWERGAVAWDTSYVATIGLEGREDSMAGLLRGLGVDVKGGGGKWRVMETWMHERESREAIAPVDIVWGVPNAAEEEEKKKKDGVEEEEEGKRRKLFIRVHPSAFFKLWEELVRLAKIAKPAVAVEDLRFEIGSIEITGPGSTEALLGALWPSGDQTEGSMKQIWTNLAGLANPSILPEGAILGFDVHDPRLHHPPRTIKLPKTQEEHDKLLQLIADWPIDKTQSPSFPALFDRTARLKGSKLPSQKAINRRKSLAPPGAYPHTLPTDPQIPILLYTSPASRTSTAQTKKRQTSASWILLAPWKCIQPIWYSIMYYPLSTGQQPRFGGLNEKRQLDFEAGRPWFPADFPGTLAGWEWEVRERKSRWEEWRRRAKGKRVVWEKVELGGGPGGRKGEVGVGWACDWSFLLGEGGQSNEGGVANNEATGEKSVDETKTEKGDAAPMPPPKPEKLTHLPSAQALKLLKSLTNTTLDLEGKLITVRLTLLTRGVPQTCARIYRVPSESSNPDLRKAWLALLPSDQANHKHKRKRKTALPNLPKDAPPHILQQRLAQSLIEPPRAGDESYPPCPPEEDLAGFVTTGNFNLAEGKGTAIGSLLLGKVAEDVRMHGEGREKQPGGGLCVVRNSGDGVGRLGRWDVV